MLVYIETEEGIRTHVRAETVVQAINHFNSLHPDTTVIRAIRTSNLKLVLEGCYDNAEERLKALLYAVEGIDDDGAIERALQEYVYCDCVQTECAEFVEAEEN